MGHWEMIKNISDLEDYNNKEINVGKRYCYINDKCVENKLDETLFKNCGILDSVCKKNKIYVLVETDCMDSAKKLQSCFIVKGMDTLPDVYDERIYKTILYIVTVKIADGSIYNFTQILPKKY